MTVRPRFLTKVGASASRNNPHFLVFIFAQISEMEGLRDSWIGSPLSSV
jgi:hypothetical protein